MDKPSTILIKEKEQEKIVNIRNEKKDLTTEEAENRKVKLLITPNQCT